MSVTRKKVSCSHSAARGVALVFVAGILTILAAIGMAFFSLTHSSMKSAVNYSDMVRAEWLAQAGIHEAVARLRVSAFLKTEDPTDNWCTVNWLNGAERRTSFRMGNGLDSDGDGIVDNESGKTYKPYVRALSSSAGDESDRFTLEVEDAGGKINLNAGDNLATILNNLCILIGPPLVAADPDLLQPRRWFEEGGPASYSTNPADTSANLGAYFEAGTGDRPLTWAEYQAKYGGAFAGKPAGEAAYGDGYAIAAYRARHGAFGALDSVKNALTYIERNGNNQLDDPLEVMEVEVKFAALRPYITLASWVDTNTVGVGKFEWVIANQLINGERCDVLIDRDKSWVEDRPKEDPYNERGSLRGSYLSIMNGHGAGQFRRIFTNGPDWIAIKRSEASSDDARLALLPGPISSYMIVAREDATPDPYDPNNGISPNRLDFAPVGDLKDNPDIDYSVKPLCIHRAPVNLNTASGIVLTALFMGLNVQHGHPLAVGTNADANLFEKATLPNSYTYTTVATPFASAIGTITYAGGAATDWKVADNVLQLEPYLLTPKGLKRIPAVDGKLAFDRNLAAFAAKYGLNAPNYDLAYLNQNGQLFGGGDAISEAHELAIRIMVARQRFQPLTAADPDPILQVDLGQNVERGPFRDWDDFYFRIVRPWDDARLAEDAAAGTWKKVPLSKMLMAHFNSNTDLLKFNPNIEWIDRWGRNFTEMEPVMVFQSGAVKAVPQPWDYTKPAAAPKGSYLTRSLRYKSSEMIDKTDLNRSTTEFAFDSNGTFEITATGQVVLPLMGQLLAERKLETVVKVYDVWRETTQRQFVRGRFSTASQTNRNAINGVQSSGLTDNGRRSRDNDPWDATAEYYSSGARCKALDTLPEPLTPLNYVIKNANGMAEYVDDGIHDTWGNVKNGGPANGFMPDMVANRVLPASYDGQLVLAANDAGWNPSTAAGARSDTFLASFNGDLDTHSSLGNGREQAKNPKNPHIRVADCIGLLGLLNDQEVDVDPDAPAAEFFISPSSDLPGLPAQETDPITGAANAVAWWNNMQVRMGDLRADGLFMGGMGTSLKEGSLKYAIDDVTAPENGQANPLTSFTGRNWDPNSTAGITVSMWFKPNWHASDGREHIFFDASALGNTSDARYVHLYKAGRFSFAKRYPISGDANANGSSYNWKRNNCLVWGCEDGGGNYTTGGDDDFMSFLHGGTWNVPTSLMPDPNIPGKRRVETPAFHAQPFRWGYVGAKFKYNATVAVSPSNWNVQNYGYWSDNNSAQNRTFQRACVEEMGHAFINTQRPSRTDPAVWFTSDWYWQYSQNQWLPSTTVPCPNRYGFCDARGQPAAFKWATTSNADRRKGVFSVCNVNESYTSWLYRASPIDGTYATIDELRLSRRAWTDDEIASEMTLSRYYLPANPADASQLPYFVSQPLIQSIRGQGVTSCSDAVQPIRVSWTVFTPRFMHEYKVAGAYTRNEWYRDPTKDTALPTTDLTSASPVSVSIRGPFDYAQYNQDVGYDAGDGWKYQAAGNAVNAHNPWLSVGRPVPTPDVQPHYSKGVEVLLLNGSNPATDAVAGKSWNMATKVFDSVSVFTNPSVLNTFPAGTRVPAANLRYCVRFKYPVSADVDPAHGSVTVDPAKHFLLDTPVLDDVSVTYASKTRILYYREARE